MVTKAARGDEGDYEAERRGSSTDRSHVICIGMFRNLLTELGQDRCGSLIVMADQIHEWGNTHADLLLLFDGVGATEDARTCITRLVGIPVLSAGEDISDRLPPIPAGQDWAEVTGQGPGGTFLRFALPVDAHPILPHAAFPFVEIHSMLAAWWLTTSWRARQLTAAGLEHYGSEHLIAAAACVRPLVETAAAARADGEKLTAAWQEVKERGKPKAAHEYLTLRQVIMKELHQIMHGAIFNEKTAPELHAVYGTNKRTNVLNAIEKLEKTSPGIQVDYQWLCNTVHPSVGTLMAFDHGVAVRADVLETHRMHVLSVAPARDEQGRVANVEQTVREVIPRAAIVALRSLHATMDALLSTFDDIALTTEATSLSTEDYWRRITPGTRNEKCPCRSGKKTKDCQHDW